MAVETIKIEEGGALKLNNEIPEALQTKISHTQRVIKNSLWLTIQPLILNFISIFATGYIARTLGQADYGIFVFAFAFVAMFAPFANMGLRAITIRTMAEDRTDASSFLGKILVLRTLLISSAFIVCVIAINLLRYSAATKMVVYIAGIIMIINAVSATIKDTFQAFEKMQYEAYTSFASGITLTALSIIVLFAGFRLIGLSMAYLLGNILGMLIGFWFLFKKFFIPKLKLDIFLWKKSIFEGRHFFASSLLAIARSYLGILMLSKLGGSIAVGIYGAASALVTRLTVIPDSVGTSVFPTVSALHRKSEREAQKLVVDFFSYLLLIGLPLSIAITILSEKIIGLIYGPSYKSSVLVLQIIAWSLPCLFFIYLSQAVLGAIHQQNKVVKVNFVALASSVLLNLLLIPLYEEIGVAVALVLTEFICLILLFYYFNKYFLKDISMLINFRLAKILAANIIMGAVLWFTKEANLLLSFMSGFTTYTLSLFILGVITRKELILIKAFIIRAKVG